MIEKVRVGEDREVAIETLRVVPASELFGDLDAVREEISDRTHDDGSGATISHFPTPTWLKEWIDEQLAEVDDGGIDESEATEQLLPLRNRLDQLPDDVLIDLEN